MYDTAKELHIGIDQGLQSINSNLKGNIEAPEKDMALNVVMIQEINSIIDKKLNRKREGFEDTAKQIDDLESLKIDTSVISSLPLYKYSDEAVFIPLPENYFRYIEVSGRTRYLANIYDPVVTFVDFLSTGASDLNRYLNTIASVKLPSVSGSDDYADFKIDFQYNISGAVGAETYTTYNLFDINEYGSYWDGANYDLHGANSMFSPLADGKFQFISMVLDHINNVSGVELGIKVYWERYSNVYVKDSFIFTLDNPKYYGYNSGWDYDLDYRIYLSPTGDAPNSAGNFDTWGLFSSHEDGRGNTFEVFNPLALVDGEIYNTQEIALYNAATFESYASRIVKANERLRLSKHPYGKTIYDSPLSVISGHNLIMYHNNTFEIDRIDMVYYRKPRTICLANNQGCEIPSDSFKQELVEKTVQKLSARLQDPNYKNLVNENLLID